MWTVRTATASASGSRSARRRIVAGLDERLEVARDERRPVVGEQRRLGADDVEEPGDVAERLLGGDRVGGREPAEQSRVAQEAVQDFAGRVGRGRAP